MRIFRMWIAICAVSNLFAVFAWDDVNPRCRVNCFPQPDVTKSACEARNCTWDSNTYAHDWNVPRCYFPKSTGLFLKKRTDDGWILFKKDYSKETCNPMCPYGQDFKTLKVSVHMHGQVMNVRIEPAGLPEKRFEPDIKLLNGKPSSSEDLTFVPHGNDQSEIFSFQIIRKSSGTPLWDTAIGGLMFADKYLQIATYLPSTKLYGFGENVHQSLLHDFTTYKTWSMSARDEAPNSVGEEDTKNLYGVHPFYMMIEHDHRAHGVFILNSNAQEVTTGPHPHLVYRTIGGILDIYFFPGPTPKEVLQQYLAFVGKPFVPPYWALGFQLCRYGYKGLEDLKTIMKRNLDARIPLEVAYADIDYMDRYQDFTTGKEWQEFGTYAKQLHKDDRHLILIFDPAVDVTSPAFKRALNADVSFIEYPRQDLVQTDINSLYPTTNNTKIMLSVVWPDHHTAFPDFYDPQEQTKNWWIKEFVDYHEQVEFDGIWIDMNEPTAFGTNENHPWYYGDQDHPNITSLKCNQFPNEDSTYDKPPFYTSAVYRYRKGELLSQKTLCMLAKTNRGSQTFYNTKNLYSLYQAMLTDEAAKAATGKRSVVMSRSSFPGSGRYTGHWLGDNAATWDDLRTSIIGVQEFNMFGIPYAGSDICGYRGIPTQELCLRWQQMGAFHPFSRNHNNKDTPDQDPAVWPPVASAAKEANQFRYHYLSYLYSLHFEAALDGGAVIRPVFFEFPDDYEAHDLALQFMWGDSIMIAPVTQRGIRSISLYLPKSAIWYSMRNRDYGIRISSGWIATRATVNELIPVYIRGGKIITSQIPSLYKYTSWTTKSVRKAPLRIIIAVDDNLQASGVLYWDDGESIISNFAEHSYCKLSMAFYCTPVNASLKIISQCNGDVWIAPVSSLSVMGYPFRPQQGSAKLGNTSLEVYMTYEEGKKWFSLNPRHVFPLAGTGLESLEITWLNAAQTTAKPSGTGKSIGQTLWEAMSEPGYYLANILFMLGEPSALTFSVLLLTALFLLIVLSILAGRRFFQPL